MTANIRLAVSALISLFIAVQAAIQGYFQALPDGTPIDWGALLLACMTAIAAAVKDWTTYKAPPPSDPAQDPDLPPGSFRPSPPSAHGRRKPRGIRNNNPGNIEYNPRNKWRGQTGSDGRFAKFSHPVYGLRALIMLLRNYHRRYGLNSVSDIIHRWAPAAENDVDAYIDHVAALLGVDETEPLDFDDPAQLARLAWAIVEHENGEQPYPETMIARAAEMAINPAA